MASLNDTTAVIKLSLHLLRKERTNVNESINYAFVMNDSSADHLKGSS